MYDKKKNVLTFRFFLENHIFIWKQSVFTPLTSVR